MTEPDPSSTTSSFKSKSGFKRLLSAMGYSIEGLYSAWRTEHAFRQELMVVAPGVLIALIVPVSAFKKLALIAVLVAILIVELINSAFEAVVDRISLERHPLSKSAKDLGSAAVMLTCLVALATWAVILWPVLFGG